MNVKSTNIQSIDYDRDDQRLFITFRSGRTYEYFHVPKDVFDSFIVESEKPDGSIGRLFSANVRGVYDFLEVDGNGN